MAAFSFEEWASYFLGPTPLAILLSILLVLSGPLFLHLFLYRSSTTVSLPGFLLIGPSGAGKTSFLTQFERGKRADTRVSQTPLTVECSLPLEARAASSRYRSVNDPSNQVHKKFLLTDTPGHGKLRRYAMRDIAEARNLKGIIFMVDAADMSSGAADLENNGLRQSAEYLHDLLLILQKRAANTKSARGPSLLPVLIAANKLDLFTALPTPLVKIALESEIAKIRTSRNKGMLDSGVGMNDLGEEKEWLAETSEGKFSFSQMEEFNVPVAVAGGSIIGTDGPDVKEWWDWVAGNL